MFDKWDVGYDEGGSGDSDLAVNSRAVHPPFYPASLVIASEPGSDGRCRHIIQPLTTATFRAPLTHPRDIGYQPKDTTWRGQDKGLRSPL